MTQPARGFRPYLPLQPNVFPAEADERIDVRWISDVLQHPAGTRESRLSLFPPVAYKSLHRMSFLSLGSSSFILLSPSPP